MDDQTGKDMNHQGGEESTSFRRWRRTWMVIQGGDTDSQMEGIPGSKTELDAQKRVVLKVDDHMEGEEALGP